MNLPVLFGLFFTVLLLLLHSLFLLFFVLARGILFTGFAVSIWEFVLSIGFLLFLVFVIQDLVNFGVVKHEFGYHFVIWNVLGKEVVIKRVDVLEYGFPLIKQGGYFVFSIESALEVFLVFLHVSIDSKLGGMYFLMCFSEALLLDFSFPSC